MVRGMTRPVSVNGRARNVYLSDDSVTALKRIGGTVSNGIRILLDKEASHDNVSTDVSRNNSVPGVNLSID